MSVHSGDQATTDPPSTRDHVPVRIQRVFRRHRHRLALEDGLEERPEGLPGFPVYGHGRAVPVLDQVEKRLERHV